MREIDEGEEFTHFRSPRHQLAGLADLCAYSNILSHVTVDNLHQAHEEMKNAAVRIAKCVNMGLMKHRIHVESMRMENIFCLLLCEKLRLLYTIGVPYFTHGP